MPYITNYLLLSSRPFKIEYTVAMSNVSAVSTVLSSLISFLTDEHTLSSWYSLRVVSYGYYSSL